MMQPTHSIYLWGMPGSGKSSIGKKLANRLGWSLVDLDLEIEGANGPISAIFEEKGEEGFRLLEQKHLHDYLGNSGLVVSCGGGTPCFFDNAQRMKRAGICVYLEADLKTLEHRLKAAKKVRPLLRSATWKRDLEAMLSKRAPFYEQAQLKIPVIGLSIEALARKIEQSIEEDGRVL